MKFVLAFVILIGSGAASQAQQQQLVFSCDGKLGEEPVHNVGLVVSLTERTASFSGYVTPIRQVDPANIYFEGSRKNMYGMVDHVSGGIDRVTGAMTASTTSTLGEKNVSSNWDMVCKPRSRMF